MDLGPVGVIAGLILLIQTVVAAVSVSRNRHYAAAYRWRRRMEPVHLDLLDWAYEVQVWATRTGQRRSMPPLPPSLRDSLHDEDDPDPELLRLRQVERHDRAT